MLKKREIHQYYVGATHIGEAIGQGHNDSHTRKNLDAAIEMAKDKLENETTECVIVVKIVAVIHRKAQPIVVEKL